MGQPRREATPAPAGAALQRGFVGQTFPRSHHTEVNTPVQHRPQHGHLPSLKSCRSHLCDVESHTGETGPNTRDKASHLASVPAEACAPSHHSAKAHGFHSLLFLLPVLKGLPCLWGPSLPVYIHKSVTNTPWEDKDVDTCVCMERLGREAQTGSKLAKNTANT